MFRKHSFHLLIAISLSITLALTVRDALATAGITSHTDGVMKCQELPSRYSIHAENVGGMRVAFSEDGPTGVDSGLLELMTTYRTCSR
jgi:hypothetical protein